ncbi:hypothetical protein D3C87_08020 [compost metagenome]
MAKNSKKIPQNKKKKQQAAPSRINPYVLRVFYILIGPIITYPIIDEEGPLRLIGLSLLFSGYHLFMLLFLDLLPEYIAYLQTEAPEKDLTPKQKRVVKFFALFFFIILGAFLGSLKILDHTIHGMQLFWWCIGIGILAGILLIRWSIKKPFSFISSDNINGFGIGFPLGIPMLFCALVFISNRYIVVESIKNESFKISEKTIGSGSRRSRDVHYIYLNLNGKTERFTVGEAQFLLLQDSITCNLKKGVFGYYFVDKIRAKS